MKFDSDILTSSMLITVTIGLLTFSLMLWYSMRRLDYWKKRNVPCVKSYPFIGSLYPMFTKSLHEVELERYKEYGIIYGHFEGFNPVLSVADPQLLRLIFVKDFQFFSSRRPIKTGDKIFDNLLPPMQGEDWKRVRNIVTPTFSTGKIRRMLNIIKECSMTVVENFIKESLKGPVEARRIYGAFTLDVIANAAFSTKLDSHNDPENEFAKHAKTVFGGASGLKILLFVIAPKIARYLKTNPLPQKPLHFFQDLTLQIIEERKRTGQRRNDFLQLLLDTANDETGNPHQENLVEEEEDMTANYGQEGINLNLFKLITKKKLSMDELVAQCIVFFIAGYDTTASTLAFATYSLALNPEVQEKAFEEIARVMQDTNGEMTYEAVQSMKYIDNVISETLRLYPIFPSHFRTADEDYNLGDTGITIEKGNIISIPIYAIQRDPKIFPNPEKFDPDRFSVEERSQRDPYTFLPFGAGPRNCVGMRFALMEIKVCLIYIIAFYKIKRCSKTKVPLEFANGPMLQPKETIVDMELRGNNPFSKFDKEKWLKQNIL